MSKIRFAIVTLLALSCHPTAPQLLFDQSYFYNHQRYIEITPQDVNLKNDSTAILTAIYRPATSKTRSSYLNIFREKIGFLRIPLARPIAAPKNSLVEITGKWKIKSQTMRYIKKTIHRLELYPDQFRQLARCEKFVPTLDSTYRLILPELQKQITVKESKLELSPKPNWKFFYDDERHRIIALSHQYDLMYSASIEFVIDPQTRHIEKIQAKEWFKGEVE
ncbi:MAG: hypothetical protein GXO74_13180 [Calditrichaeota bacterium]|nr:hypothetical protein [Calditrichota bacterium]